MTDTNLKFADIARFNDLRSAAVAHALSAGERAAPEYYARLDERGRAACAEDIAFHLDYLQPALETGDTAPFVNYLAWLAEVLRSRGVPIASLARSLDDLAEFFSANLGEAAAPVVAALAAGKPALEQPRSVAYDTCCPEHWAEAADYLQAAINGQQREASAALAAAVARCGSLAEAAIHVVQPALYDIGRLWQTNQVSVAQEHLATALTATVLAQHTAHAPIAPDRGWRIVLACAAGNHHTVGLRMLADAFDLDGWQSYFLGADTPAKSIISEVARLKPHIVGLSAALPHHLRGLRETVSQLRAAFGADCPKILIGGLIFNQTPELLPPFQPDLFAADACAAVTQANVLMQAARAPRS